MANIREKIEILEQARESRDRLGQLVAQALVLT